MAMEYTIGSIADIISGKNTPNKPKVIKKEFPNLFPNTTTEDNSLVQGNNKIVKIENNRRNEGDSNENIVPFKRNKPIRDEQNKSSKKKSKKPSTSLEDNFTVIDHTQIDKLEKALTEGKLEREDVKEEMQEDDADEDVKPKVDQKEVDSRTVFVGNVAVTAKKKQLLRFFGKFGKIVSVRLRNATPAQPGISKRVAMIKKMLHPKRTTLHCYITFERREDALKSLELNGKEYKEHRLRVQMCDDTTKPDLNKAIFVGNLPFEIEDDDLWKAFESCGSIASVRVVRNSSTGMGIGIGYVNFESSDSVELALQMEDVTIKNKTVRIQRCHDKKGSRRQRDKKKHKPERQDQDKKKIFRKFKRDGEREQTNPNEKKEKHKSFDKPSDPKVKNSVFQGSKSNKKKEKHKVNKGAAQKLKLSQKIAPR